MMPDGGEQNYPKKGRARTKIDPRMPLGATTQIFSHSYTLGPSSKREGQGIWANNIRRYTGRKRLGGEKVLGG